LYDTRPCRSLESKQTTGSPHEKALHALAEKLGPTAHGFDLSSGDLENFDFSADVSTARQSTVKTTTSFQFEDPSGYKLRKYQGTLVRGKPEAERKLFAQRIKQMDVDVLAVQEVEDIDTLLGVSRPTPATS
jgi:hypothetical protein